MFRPNDKDNFNALAIEKFKRFRENLPKFATLDSKGPLYEQALKWLASPEDLGYKPTPQECEDLIQIACRSYGISRRELEEDVAKLYRPSEEEGQEPKLNHEEALWKLIPPTGFFRLYCEMTKETEAPLSYHLFSALSIAGAVVNRRCVIRIGPFKHYAAMGIILIGPSSARKTSAADIAVSILRELDLVPVYSEHSTPEALMMAISSNPLGLFYAPELTHSINKKKYMEGATGTIVRMQDCPDRYDHATKGEGVITIRNVAISLLGCTTVDWLATNAPEELVRGGFTSRNLLIVQEPSNRCCPLPDPVPDAVRDKVLLDLKRIALYAGTVTLSSECEVTYKTWAGVEKGKADKAPELLSSYYGRKAGHVLRISMLLHLSTCGDLEICKPCFDRAVGIIDLHEPGVTPVLERLENTSDGKMMRIVLDLIRKNGNSISEKNLIRKMRQSHGMTAAGVHRYVASLRAEGILEIYQHGSFTTYIQREDK